MRVGAVVAVFAVALAAWGCAGAGERTEPGASMGEDLAATMEVKVGVSSVRLVLHVTNAGEEPVRVTFPSSQRYDFVVETGAGEEVWRWSEGMMFTQALSEATLPPGDSWTMDAVWEPGDRTGEYVATGVLTARDRELRQATAFRLE